MRANPSPVRNGSPCLPDSCKRLRAPRAQRAVLQIAPQRGVLNVVLQVAIRRARGIAHPRRDEDADRDQPVRMHIEEAEDLRLGKSEGVPDGAGLQRRILRQLDHHLHAQRPLALRVSRRHSDSPVERLPHRAHRSVADHRQRRMHIHPGHESIRRRARAVDPLIGQPNPLDGVSLLARFAREDRRAHRRSRPYLHQAGGHQLRARPTG